MGRFDNIRNLRRGLVALAIVFPMLCMAIAIGSIWQSYNSAVERAELNVRNISVSLNEHAQRTVGEADSRMLNAIAEIRRRDLSLSGLNDADIHNILKWNTLDLSPATAMHAIDANGWGRVYSLAYPLTPYDARNRDYYTYHVEHTDSALHMSPPLKSTVTGKWVITLSRRINNKDGSLKMVIILGLRMDYFNDLYRSLHMGKGSNLMLVRKDGRVFMQSPLTEKVIDLNLGKSQLLTRFKEEPAGLFQVDDSLVDGTSRIVGYASSNDFPLIASASVSRADALAPWLKQTWQIALVGIISMMMLQALILLLWRRLNDLQASQESVERKHEALIEAKQHYQELVDGIDGIVWEAELPSFRFTYVSANAAEISSYSAEEWLINPRFWHDKLSGQNDVRDATALALSGHAASLLPVEHHIVKACGRSIWLRSNMKVAATKTGSKKVLGVTTDITQQKNSEKTIFQMTHFDPLTNLPNRQTLQDRIEHALAVHSKTGVAVLMLDLDQFNTINDSLGHAIGDQVLCQVALRIAGCLRETDTLARIGGDEFMVLMEGIGNGVVGVEQMAEKITLAMGEAFLVADRELYTSLSIGISLFPKDSSDCGALMRNADTALHRAQSAGRNCWRFFDESMAYQVARRLELETALRGAVDRNELVLHYQPQYSLDQHQMVGVEALLRWSRPGLGLVPPIEFLPLAEETGLIVPIGLWVLEEACGQAILWAWKHGTHPLRMSVNVAAKQLQQDDFVVQVHEILRRTGMPANMLELEITESAIVENIDEVVRKLHRIRALGVSIAIDDFGTGYSSLSYLKELPIDRLKIDRSFVQDIPVNSEDCAIVRTIISMARNLDLDVIAEGVELAEQIEFLQEQGCTEIQGYILSKPAPASEIEKLGTMSCHFLK